MSPTTLQSRVTWLCESSGVFSREDLSQVCGLAKSHLGHLVNGRHKSVRSDVAEKLCGAFGCTPSWLLFGEGKPPSAKSVAASIARARANNTASKPSGEAA
jgi:DNA-binding Xre family transcriptional regulator